MLQPLWLLLLLAAAATSLSAAQLNRLNNLGAPRPSARGSSVVNANRGSKGHLFVSTADGYLHRIDVGRGKQPVKQWSTSIGPPMVASYQSPTTEAQRFAVVPAVDGTILIRTSDGIRRIPMKARMIADRTPFVANDGTMYTGSKKSRIIALDINTGLALQEVSDEGAALAQVEFDKNTVVWVTRVDVAIRAFSPNGVEQWNVTFSEVLPLTGGTGQAPDIARPPDPLIATPEGELVYSDFTIPLSAPATGAFALTHTLSLNSLPVPGQASPFAAHQVNIVYRAPKSAAIDSHAHNAVVRSLQDNQLYAVVLPPQTNALPDAEPSNQLSTIIRPDLRTTSPLVNPRQIKEPRTWLSWLHQQSAPPLTPVFLGDDQQPTELTESECAETEEIVDSSCLIGVHPIISDPALELALYGMDPNSGYDLSKAGGEFAGWPYPALPYPQNRDNAGFAVDVYHPDPFRPYPHLPGQMGGSAWDWWTTLNQVSTILLLLIVVLYGVAKRWRSQLRQLLRKLGLPNIFASTSQAPREERNIGNASNTPVEATPPERQPKTNGGGNSEHGNDDDNNDAGPGTAAADKAAYKIEITEDVLGYGAQGTIVFRGKVDNRPVAVKRMIKDYWRQAHREIKLLIQSDGHPHVVRYYLKEERQEFVYLALQLCETSLHKFVSNVSTAMAHAKLRRQNPHLTGANLLSQLEAHRAVDPRDVHAPFVVRRALLQAAEGVAHLHSLRIVHRDVKPQNILLAAPEGFDVQGLKLDRMEQLAQFTLKISDMGLGKQLDAEGNSTSLSLQPPAHGEPPSGMSAPSASADHHPVGTIGWQAPELMSARRQLATLHRNSTAIEMVLADAEDELALMPSRPSEKVDIFSLGCVFYFVLVPMEHPFGEWFDRESNIMNNRANLSKIQHIDDAHDLISRMIQHNPAARPTAAEVCRHPFFWSEEKRLSFLLDFSDRLENEATMSPLVLEVESNAVSVVGQSWESLFHSALLEDVARYRRYDTSSVRDCLRLIRNKRHHFHELPADMKQLMSPVPGGFLRYFESRIPKLLMHCFRAACQHLTQERDFAQYCAGIAALYQRSAVESGRSSVRSGNQSPMPIAERSAQEEEKKEAVSSKETEEKKEEECAETVTSPGSVVLWSGSALADAHNSRGWWRPSSTWRSGLDVIKKRARPTHLQRAATEPKYRTRLCTHWENTGGQNCPMKKKGKCDFAHGPLELRVKENRRARWGASARADVTGPESLRLSGGEDTLGAARTIEQVRLKEGSLSEFERSAMGGAASGAAAGHRPQGSQPRRPRGK